MDISPLQTLISLIYTLLGSFLFVTGILICKGIENRDYKAIESFLYKVTAMSMLLIGALLAVLSAVCFVGGMFTLAGL